MNRLNHISIKGFKSIRDMQLDLRPLNVLIGMNGAGKSNFVNFFKMLNEMMGQRLQEYIAVGGRASTVLHFGPKITPQIEAELVFDTNNGDDIYSIRMFYAAGDTLVFADERLFFQPFTNDWKEKQLELGAGHLETRIIEKAEDGEPTAKVFRHLLNRCRVFHFHDTSSTAPIRQYCYKGHHYWLMPDAGNLAAVLYSLKTAEETAAYRRIRAAIRRIAPYFDDFILEPEGVQKTDLLLNWRQRKSEQVFGPHQISDGTLRAMALITLLLLPDDQLPSMIIVDEPELGLHPAAISIISDLFRNVSQRCQVLIATQSTTFLNTFNTEDVIVVEHDGRKSSFHRLNEDELVEWLQEYTLSELWQKNVLGGGPYV